MNFKILARKNKLAIRITDNRKASFVFLPVNIVPDYWSNDANIPLPKHPNYRQLLNYISSTQQMLDEFAIDLLQHRMSLSAVKSHIQESIFGKKVDRVNLQSFTDTLISEMLAEKKPGNAKWYKQAVDSFMEWHKNEILFEDITYSVLLNYRNFLKAEGLSPNSISNYLRAIRAIYREADRRDIFQSQWKYPFQRGLIPSLVRTMPRNISFEDVHKLESSCFKNPKIQQAVDYWLISFYLQGADFIDLANLHSFNLSDNYFKFSRAKTGQPVAVRVTNKLSDRLSRYYSGAHGYILNIIHGPITDPKSMELYQNKLKAQNKYIKMAANELGIGANLTSKWNRHSWITIAKRLFVDEDIRRQAVGHRDQRSSHSIYSDDYQQHIVDAANALVIGEINYDKYIQLIKSA